MKKLVCGVLVFVLLAGGALGCAKKDEVPSRGVWDGRTYTNTRAGIRLTVPEEYRIDTDEELIKWRGFPADYFNDLMSKPNYCDIYIDDIASGSYSRMYIEYSIGSSNTTAEQELNYYKTKNTRYNLYNNNMDAWFNIIYGDNFEITLCGETYLCCGFTLEYLQDTFYQLICYRITAEKATVFIDIHGKDEETVNAYLAFFDKAAVK